MEIRCGDGKSRNGRDVEWGDAGELLRDSGKG